MERDVRDFAGPNLKKIQTLYSDNAPEFKLLKRRLELPNRTSTPRRPNTNARQERRMGIFGDQVRTRLHKAKLGLEFWPLAGNHTAAIHNFKSINSDGKTPYEALGYKPFVGYLRPFGVKCTYVPPAVESKKYDPRGVEAVFVGYYIQDGLRWTGDYLCVPRTYFTRPKEKLRIIRTRDIKFPEENVYPIAELRKKLEVLEFQQANQQSSTLS